MNYLKKYGLTDEDIDEIYDSLSDEDWYTINCMDTRVEKILKYFKSLGITNFKDMFIYKPNIFNQHVDEIENYINESNIPDIIEKLKEDVTNFDLLGI